MSFVRIRTIKGKQYRYLEERWREGGKVRSRSTSLGRVSGGGVGFSGGGEDDDAGWLRRQMGHSDGLDWDAIMREQIAMMDAEDAKHAAHEARVHAAIGLTMPAFTGVPIEKYVPDIHHAAPAAVPGAGQESAPPSGGADVSETQGP